MLAAGATDRTLCARWSTASWPLAKLTTTTLLTRNAVEGAADPHAFGGPTAKMLCTEIDAYKR